MPTPTYIPLSTITLGSAASSVTFGSIPQTYRDLVLVSNVIQVANTGHQMRVNGDTASNYSFVQMAGTGTGTFSNSGSSVNYFTPFYNSNPSTSTTDLGITVFMDYSATDKHKTMLLTNSSNATTASPMVARSFASWANTAAINSIICFPVSGNLAVGASFSLYGIEA
jgi:hypothetical protein